MDTLISRLSFHTASLIIAAAAFLCYYPSLAGDFVFDDSEAVVGNEDVSGDVHWTQLFLHDFWGKRLTSKHSHKSYRPLTVLTFRWNFWMSGGLHPWGFHLTNILLHPVVSVLVMKICSLMMGRIKECRSEEEVFPAAWKSFVVGLLFAVHPVHTESIAGVVGRADLMSALCFFLSFWAFHQSCYGKKVEYDIESRPTSFSLNWIIVCVMLCGLSMLFKEQGITAVGICFVYDVLVVCKINVWKVLNGLLFVNHRDDKDRQSDSKWIRSLVYRQCVMILSAVILLGIRFRIMGTGPPKFQPVDNPASFSNSTFTRVATYNYIYAINGWLLLNPLWLCFDWSMGCIPLVENVSDVRLLPTLLFWVAMLAVIWTALVNDNTEFRQTIGIGLAFLVVPFLPASNLFFKVGFVVAERVLYIPVVGFCILITAGLSRLSGLQKLRNAGIFIFISLVLVFSLRSVQRSAEWRNETDLFTRGVFVCPLNAKVHYNIGKVMSEKGGKDDVALAAYREAVRLHPEYDQAWNNLGNLLKDKGETEEAEHCLQNALDANPEFAAAWMNLGIVKASLHKSEEAERCYRTAIIHRRKYPDAYYNLGNLYIELKRFDDAMAAFRNATALKADHVNSWTNLAILFETNEQYDEAETVLNEALTVLPDHPGLIYNLANVLGKVGRYNEAERHFKKALQSNPNSAQIHANMAVAYHRAGKLDLAEASYKASLKLDPSNELTKSNLNKLLRQKQQ
ncbi:protein O-mannosyl-transferase TMTC4-like [Corticium candelabrum]|uniref:protein O-mannosyl-transferase TMTC4-like n=1 Tax=Corticium candelabrum TaxID=121492 RepID=UPI002E274714|nr:protein O-mannosyl-transferase TMTC4-like [Corticium candelabrum]